MTGAESFFLKRQLAREGWNLRVFPYSSIGEPMDAVARRCARYARDLALRTLAPVHLLGHSLGGLILLRMFELGLLAPDRFSGDFCRVVLLGVPVNGSQSGRAVARFGPVGALLGKAGREALAHDVSADSACRCWRHETQIGVIAGDRPHGLGRFVAHISAPNDGTVAVSETRLEGAADQCLLPVSHIGMLISDDVATEVAHFLAQGCFSRR
jgi:pimeloyl-ACP methyl ester carboxylesterase